ncbi:hypothetical protein GCM10023336_70620 [Streptomyces similanensis]|uniref:Uncharacterized protein n=1 Tax=Streptomyces similanensis TaxID=1274988 RepID=A0ABP9LKG9_9ACTN
MNGHSVNREAVTARPPLGASTPEPLSREGNSVLSMVSELLPVSEPLGQHDAAITITITMSTPAPIHSSRLY